MSIRHAVAVSLLAVCLAVPAEAQKRRAVRTIGAPPPVSNQCHTFGLVSAGTIGTYVTTTPQGNVNIVITWISDTPTRTHTTQKVQTPQGAADVETILDGEVVGSLRGLRHLLVKTTTQVPVFGSVVTEVEIDFVPSLIAGPAGGWCPDAKWDVPPVTETIVTRGPAPVPPQIVTTLASSGQVLAVDDVISVPAGTFHTVKYRGVVASANGVQTAVTWVSKERNVVVKQDTLDANGVVTSVTQLVALQ